MCECVKNSLEYSKDPRLLSKASLFFFDPSHLEFGVVHCGKYVFPRGADRY